MTTSLTRLERAFDADAVRDLLDTAPSDVSIGGPGLAAHALRAGLVDEINLLLVPAVVGGGTSVLPGDLRIDLDLRAEHRFASGVVHLRYGVRSGTT